MVRFSTCNPPVFDGQYAGGLVFSIIAGASCSTPKYSSTRSMLLKSSSTCAATLNQIHEQRAKPHIPCTCLTSCLLASANIPAWTMTMAARPSLTPLHSANIVEANTTTEPRPDVVLGTINGHPEKCSQSYLQRSHPATSHCEPRQYRRTHA